MTEPQSKHPYAGVDIARLDTNFISLLEYAARPDYRGEEKDAPGQRLSLREQQLFRFGVFAGLAEWTSASDLMGSLVGDGIISRTEAERALLELALVKGLPACGRLQPSLNSLGLHVPADVMEAAKAVQALRDASPVSPTSSDPGLTEREVFALGLGITWGARCWDT